MRARQENSAYRTALYLRLSKDDEGAGESSSITTQRGILQDYVRTHGLPVVGEYVDDGYSGTNYERPAFQRMIADIESGKVNCVITKDLSRLGRNSARTSDLLDEYFPLHGVRYISVIDGYDSLHLTSGVVMTAPLMMAMHEMYARDISCKIRTSFRTKMEKGEFIGSFAPYGYQKDEKNKNHLVVDHQVSYLVQEIFQLAADGHAPGEIAKYLNHKGVATPAVYRCSARPYLDLAGGSGRREWSSSMICKMLKDIVYLGHTAQGKTSKVSFKSKAAQAQQRDKWIVVENTHEPLISEEQFRLVRNRSVSRRSPPAKGFENVFSGIARCADCGRSMTTAPSRKKGVSHTLCCGGYKTYGAKECGNHFIDYELLYHTVRQELRPWLSMTDSAKAELLKELEREEIQRHRETSGGTAQALAKLERRSLEISALLKKLYEDYAFGRITAALYERLSSEYETELAAVERSRDELKGRMEPERPAGGAYRECFALLDAVTDTTVLTRPLLRKLVDRIEVGQGEYVHDEHGKRKKVQKIRIYYRFLKPDGTP